MNQLTMTGDDWLSARDVKARARAEAFVAERAPL